MSDEAAAIPLERAPDDGDRLTGGCQCGAVRYALAGRPEEISLCHCRMCQKASGGPFMTFARFADAAVTWTRGTLSTFASSNHAIRGFCARCGTPLTYRSRAEAISFSTGSFDDPAAMIPTSRLGIEALLPWSEHVDQLPIENTDGAPGRSMTPSMINHQHPDHDT